MKFTLESLRQKEAALDEITIHSYDMGLYLVELTIGANKGLLCEKSGRPVRFKSVEHVKNGMSGLLAAKVQLKHKSAFDEMIGNPDSAKQPLAIPLSW